MTNILAIYCRTSKNKEKGKDYSIESQKQGGVKLAAELGINYKFYIDEGLSGTLDNVEDRPAFAEMIGDIKSGKILSVYCIDQSRIERNTDIWRFFVAICINQKCRYYPNGKELDLEDEESMLFANLLSLFNSFYAKITSRKVKIANDNKARKGKTHGLKAYGYKRDENNNYIIFESEAKHVRRMFELSLQGIGTYTIANIFNEEGIPTKYNRFEGVITRLDKYTKRESLYQKNNIKWRGNVIYDMLCNEIYKGIRVWKDIRVPVPAIVSEELWQKVNDNLSKNKKLVGKKAQYHYLLNGLLLCAYCGNEYIGKKRIKGNDTAYKCKGTRPPHKVCTESRGISLPKLDTFIINHLFYNRKLKELLSQAPKNGNEISRLKLELEKEINEEMKTKKQIERLAKILKDPDLTDDDNFLKDYKTAKELHAVCSVKIQKLNERIIVIENGARNKRSKDLIESYREGIGFDELKKLVHSLIERIEICHVIVDSQRFFGLKIIYKGYHESSTILTRQQAMTWHWEHYHREIAMNEEQLELDKDLLKYLIESGGKKVSDFQENIDGFHGFKSVEKMNETTILRKEELIRFDYE